MSRIGAKNLKGLTITSIDGNKNSEELIFHLSDGRSARMFHSQDCCESVSIEDISGDLEDLIGNPLLQAEEVISGEPSEEIKAARVIEEAEYRKKYGYYYGADSETWTFYKFATIKGSVTIRWYGTSNGYYSESVDIELK